MKRFIPGIMIISAALALSSCTYTTHSETSSSPSASASASAVSKSDKPTATATPANSKKPETDTMSITYNGRVDSNFIEVLLPDGSFSTMKLSDTLKNTFDDLELTEGSKVKVKYIEKDGQKIITEFLK